jgi:ribonuclease R
MRSQAKLTYGGVARALGFSTEPPRDPKAEEMVDGLRVAHECSRILRSRRMRRGALDFDLPEPVVKLDGEGKPIRVTRRAKDPGVKKAYQLIEELMIFANEVVARWLLERELPGVFRVHLPPDPKKLERLGAMCEALGIELDVEETQTPKGLAAVLERFSEHPSAAVLNNLLLRSMKQASYDVANLGHFGLASEAYLHFTSPIRRYPDLVVHRIVHAALEDDERARKKMLARVAAAEPLQEAALQSSTAERRAMEVEREILDIYRCFHMIDRIGERFEGTVSAFVGSGAFVTLDEPFVDVLVRTEDLGGDFVIDDDGLAAVSARSGEALRLGDRMMVEVIDVAILRRTVSARRIGAGASDVDAGAARRRPRDPRAGENSRLGAASPRHEAARPERGGASRSGKDRRDRPSTARDSHDRKGRPAAARDDRRGGESAGRFGRGKPAGKGKAGSSGGGGRKGGKSKKRR